MLAEVRVGSDALRTRLDLVPPAVGAPEAGSATREDEVVYGVLRLAGIEVALPLSGLREIVPCPSSFAALPAPAAGLRGAMQLRRQIIPVLDLRGHLTDSSATEQGDDDEDRDSIVAVLTDGTRMLGVLADRLRAVAVVPSADLIGLETLSGARQPLYSASFRHDVPGGIVSVLDVPAILGLPDVPTVSDPTQELRRLTLRSHQADEGTQDHTLLRCGDHVLAVHIGHVHTTLPAIASDPSLLDNTLCQGVRDYGDLRVPVVDPLRLLGLGSLPPHEPTSGLVLKLAGGYVVLAINALVDIVDIPAAQIAPAPQQAFDRADLLVGIGQGELSQGCLVLDGAALMAESALGDLARLNTRIDGTDTVAAPRSAGGPGPEAREATLGASQLVYDIGITLATPLAQIRSILPMTSPPTETNVGGAMLGIVSHQGAVVPVLSLTSLLDHRPRGDVGTDAEEHYALLVETADGSCVAFAVHGLRAIEPLTWHGGDGGRAAGQEGVAPSAGSPADLLRSSALITVAGNPRHLPQLDLRAVAATL